jgi:hypothetical protein
MNIWEWFKTAKQMHRDICEICIFQKDLQGFVKAWNEGTCCQNAPCTLMLEAPHGEAPGFIGRECVTGAVYQQVHLHQDGTVKASTDVIRLSIMDASGEESGVYIPLPEDYAREDFRPLCDELNSVNGVSGVDYDRYYK